MRRFSVILAVFGLCLGMGSVVSAQDKFKDIPEIKPRVHWSPVGKQFFLWGLQASAWFGQGSIETVTDDGSPRTHLGDFSDRAWGIGPLNIGFAHVVAREVLFELRLGAGAVFFENDRLVSQDLKAEGGAHVGLELEAEVIGRYFTESGFSVALGMNMGSTGLPDESAAALKISPRIGYLDWEEGYKGYTLWEVGYQIPIIGLVPDVEGAGIEPPIESTWHIVTLSVTFGD